MNIEAINQILMETGIRVTGKYLHAKASESYVDVEIVNSDNVLVWDGAVPYQYRRTGLWLGTEQEVADYLREIREHFSPDNIQRWIVDELAYWEENFRQADVTTPIFRRLLSME